MSRIIFFFFGQKGTRTIRTAFRDTRRREGGRRNEKAPSWVSRGLHSEGLAAGGDSPPGMLSVLYRYYQFQIRLSTVFC